MEPNNTRLQIVHLIEPDLCLSCRFAEIALVERADGKRQRMLRCRRRDCDNWLQDPTGEEPRILRHP
jgi:hypothetical protein